MSADANRQQTPSATGIAGLQTPSLIIGLVGLALSILGWFISPETFYRSWLPSYLFWFQIAAGSLAVLMLQYVTGGEWGIMIRRPLGAAARTMWLMALLLLPMIFGLRYVFPWSVPSIINNDPVLVLKKAYLNPQAHWIRTAAYFAFMLLWAWRVRILSLEFYEDRSPYTELKRRKWAASGLLVMVLTFTFFSIDWMLSTEPRWTSTMYGINFTVSCGLASFAFVTMFLALLSDSPAMAEVLKPSHLRDLGNLMLAFVMLYAYTAFSEFLLIWYANLKEEIPHYTVRDRGGWGVLAALIVLFHFFLPFVMLLMRAIKDRPKSIFFVTVVILVMRYIATYWLVSPSWWHEEFHYSWINLATLFGIGGIWMWAFIGQLKGQTIIPIHETWVEEAIREGALKVHA